jgi:hypothetical protein
VGALTAALLALAGPAAAGWRYTEWGMSEAQVLAAGDGAVGRFFDPRPEPWGVYPDLIGDFRDHRRDYEVEFYFDKATAGLVGVRLVPYGQYWCLDILVELRDRYGWFMERRGGLLEWHDERANNLISYRQEPCSVRFQPIRLPGR